MPRSLLLEGSRKGEKKMKSSNKGRMKTLVVKKAKTDKKIAQCCAKISVIVAGCHD